MTSRVGPARRLERASRRPTADGPALPGVREPGPGRQVGPPAARRVGRKSPGGEKEWRIWGSWAGGLSNGRKLDQLSPGNAECRALGTSGSSLEDQRLTAPQKRQWVTLLDTRECVPRRGLRGTTFCLRLVSAPDHGHKVFRLCVNRERSVFWSICIWKATVSESILVGYEFPLRILGPSFQPPWGPSLTDTKLRCQSPGLFTIPHIS